MRVLVDDIIETLANEAIIAQGEIVKMELQRACKAIVSMEKDIYDMANRGACVGCTESKDDCNEENRCKGFRYLGPEIY